jgi:UDP-hydrolysing UDP-N-acetyl-D-glucosamine 2-epimerase
MKKIGIVTGSRSDFGLLNNTIQAIQGCADFESVVYVCGSHLSYEHGYTVNEVKESGIKNLKYVEMLLSGSSRVGLVKSVGLALISFAEKFNEDDLDCLLVLGDRYEIMAAAQAAFFNDIPIAHIHGGEVTEGAFDDTIRHAITKMAHIHFSASDEFVKRIIQLGEPEELIYNVGAPGIENIKKYQSLEFKDLNIEIDKKFKDNLALVTYHPVTKGTEDENNIEQLLKVIIDHPHIGFIITYPNADGSDQIISQWKQISDLKNVCLIKSLGFKRYQSLMKIVKFVIGNSSSGIIEAPSFKIPTINIGTRQDGRPQATTIINCAMNSHEISQAIQKSYSDELNKINESSSNPYDGGNTSQKILEILKKTNFKNLKLKKFVDL